jgi:hypothetical protein
VVVNGAQVLVLVNVTVVEPPVAGGAPVLSLVNVPPHPPLADAVASQAAKAALICACVCPKASVWLVGQVSTTGGGAGTVNVASQDWLPQALIWVNVSVVFPPQTEGTPWVLVNEPLQPPLKLAVLSQLEYAVFS